MQLSLGSYRSYRGNILQNPFANGPSILVRRIPSWFPLSLIPFSLLSSLLLEKEKEILGDRLQSRIERRLALGQRDNVELLM